MEIELYNIITEIAYGLKSKNDKIRELENSCFESNQKYISDVYLMRAINKLVAFGVKYKIFNKEIIPKNETDAIINIFSKKIIKWIKNLEKYLNEDLSNLYFEEPLIELYGKNKYKITDFCCEIADQCILYDMDKEERKFFGKLVILNQNQYEYVRKFVIERPIIGVKDRSEFSKELKRLGLEDKIIDELIESAYENIPNNAFFYCSNCGWTVSKDIDNSKFCIDERCREKTNNFKYLEDIGDTRMKLRLKPGVMRYIALPGFLELNIVKFCIKNKLDYTLWPNKDLYDIRVKKKNGDIIVIDAKDYKSAFTLANTFLKSNNLFNDVDYTRAFIVVPDEAKERKYDYCMVVDNALKRVNKNVRCITITELFKFIGEV